MRKNPGKSRRGKFRARVGKIRAVSGKFRTIFGKFGAVSGNFSLVLGKSMVKFDQGLSVTIGGIVVKLDFRAEVPKATDNALRLFSMLLKILLDIT